MTESLGNKRFDFKSLLSLFACIAFFLVLCISTAYQKSAHFDETAHLMSGYEMLANSEYRIGTANLILSQKLSALPLLLIKSNYPSKQFLNEVLSAEVVTGAKASEAFLLGFQFLNRSGNDPRIMLFSGRMIMILVAGIGGIILVYLWSSKIFGKLGGLISAFFMASSPEWIAHSGIIGTDALISTLFLATTWSFWKLLHKISFLNIFLFAVSLLCLLLTKLSCLVFMPFALCIIIVRIFFGPKIEIADSPVFFQKISKKYQGLTAKAILFFLVIGFVAAIVYLGIWLAYDFRFSAKAPSSSWQANIDWQKISDTTKYLPTFSPGAILSKFALFAKSWKLLPEAFLRDFCHLSGLTENRLGFLLGKYSSKGWFFYFPFVFLVKTSFPVLISIFFAISILILKIIKKDVSLKRVYECLPVAIFIIVYSVISITRSINIGHRHILPLYPFIFILLGSLSCVFLLKQRLLPKIFVIILLTLSFLTAVITHPNHLAYISPFAGGPYKSYFMLVDSSIEWGQELPALKKYLDRKQAENPNIKIYLSYFGTGDPKFYGIKAKRLFGFPDPIISPCGAPQDSTITEKLEPGIYLISATMLQPVYYRRKGAYQKDFDFNGEWNYEFEQRYNSIRKDCEECLSEIRKCKENGRIDDINEWFKNKLPADVPEDTNAEKFWLDRLAEYDILRFARLTFYLRNNEPLEHINYSIYAFELSADTILQIFK